jgi:hypothetical protein
MFSGSSGQFIRGHTFDRIELEGAPLIIQGLSAEFRFGNHHAAVGTLVAAEIDRLWFGLAAGE